jgi:site-specific recombinase XerD
VQHASHRRFQHCVDRSPGVVAAGLLDATGAPRYTPHQLRHTRGSELIAEGQRIEIVQRVLGHRDIRSTLGYAELQETQIRAALERPAR